MWVNERIKVLKQMTTWITPKYIDLRLYTMYGSRYIIYILCHPIRLLETLTGILIGVL